MKAEVGIVRDENVATVTFSSVRSHMELKDTLDIATLIDEGKLEMHFQPISSVRRRGVLGIEALVRARDSTGTLIAPDRLFRVARQQNQIQALDEQCQRLALQAFAPLHHANPELILFLNIDAVSLAQLDGTRVSFLQTEAEAYRIDPRNIAVEILESRFSDVDGLKKAVAEYRKNSFLVALDDLGAGDSNLDRITYVQPDLIKADRSLIQNINTDFFKQEVFKSLVQLADRIGGWVVAEGIETREEVLTALDLGGDLLQGYYLGRPEKLPITPQDGEAAKRVLHQRGENLRQIGNDFKQFAIEKLLRERSQRQERLRIARQIRDVVEAASLDTVEAVLRQTIRGFPVIESACVLDAQGRQLTDAVLAPGNSERQKSVIYAPPGKGADHSLKEYVYVLMELPLSEYETVPYVPLPNTDLCITVSLRYYEPASGASSEPQERILCLHTLLERGVLERDPAPKVIAINGPEMPRRHDGS